MICIRCREGAAVYAAPIEGQFEVDKMVSEQLHGECRGYTWCDCQHHTPRHVSRDT